MRQLDRLEVDPALTHQRHDDGSANQVIAVPCETAHDRQLALPQRVVVLGQRLRVLSVGRAHASDRRYAEPYQVAIGLRAVALKVAPLGLESLRQVRIRVQRNDRAAAPPPARRCAQTIASSAGANP